jgi:hypothetical protein
MDLINNSIVAKPNPPRVGNAGHLLSSRRERVVAQGLNLGGQSLLRFARQFFHLPKRLELYGVGQNHRLCHSPSFFSSRSPRELFAGLLAPLAPPRYNFGFQLFQKFYVLDRHHGGYSSLAPVYDNSFTAVFGAAQNIRKVLPGNARGQFGWHRSFSEVCTKRVISHFVQSVPKFVARNSTLCN